MVLRDGKKYACETCIKGHRSSSCQHRDRALWEIKPKGRPVSQCQHCRELRKTKQVHVKCECDPKTIASKSASPSSSKGSETPQPSGSSGAQQTATVGRKGTKKIKPFEATQPAFPNGIPDLAQETTLLTGLSNGEHNIASSSGPPTPENGNPTITEQCACDGTPANELCSCCTPRYKPKPRVLHSGPESASSSNGGRQHIVPALSLTIPTSRPPSTLTTPVDSASATYSSAMSPSSATSLRHHAGDGHQVGVTQSNYHSRRPAPYQPYPSSTTSPHHRSPRSSADHMSLQAQLNLFPIPTNPPAIDVSDDSGGLRHPESMDIDGEYERPHSSLSIRSNGTSVGDGGLENAIGAASHRHNSTPTDPSVHHKASLGLLSPDWIAGVGLAGHGLNDPSLSESHFSGGMHNGTVTNPDAYRMPEPTDANSPSAYGGASPYPSENGYGDNSPLLPSRRSLTPLQTMLGGLSPHSPNHDGASPNHPGSPYHHPSYARSSEALSPGPSLGEGGHEDDESVLERASAALKTRSSRGRVGHSRSRSRGQSPIPPRKGHSSPSQRHSISGSSSPTPLNTNVGLYGQYTQSPSSPIHGGGLSPVSPSHISPTSQPANQLNLSPNGRPPIDMNALFGTGSIQQQHHNHSNSNTASDCAEGLCTCAWHNGSSHGGDQCADAGDKCGCCESSSTLNIPGTISPPSQSRSHSRNHSRRNSSLGGAIPPPGLEALSASLGNTPNSFDGASISALLQGIPPGPLDGYGNGMVGGGNNAFQNAGAMGFAIPSERNDVDTTSQNYQQAQLESMGLGSLTQPTVGNQTQIVDEFLSAFAPTSSRSRSSSSASLPATPLAEHTTSSMFSGNAITSNGNEIGSPDTPSSLSRSSSTRTDRTRQFKPIRSKPSPAMNISHHPAFTSHQTAVSQSFSFPGKQSMQIQGPEMISTDVRAISGAPSPQDPLSSMMFSGLAISKDNYAFQMPDLGMGDPNSQERVMRQAMSSDHMAHTRNPSSSTASSPFPTLTHTQPQLAPSFNANIIDPNNRMTMAPSNGPSHHQSNHTRSASYSHEGNPHPPNAGHSRSTSYDHQSRSPSPYHNLMSTTSLGVPAFAGNLAGSSSFLHPGSAANIEVIITPASPYGAGASAGS